LVEIHSPNSFFGIDPNFFRERQSRTGKFCGVFSNESTTLGDTCVLEYWAQSCQCLVD
jgi:hypothetical protein